MADEAKTNAACDVAVIGGGVIGLSCAWRLAQRGAKVSLFERGQIGREASWAAAGMLAAQVEAAHHPPDDSPSPARSAMLDLCLKSRALYPSFADELFDVSGIDIELSLQGHARGDWRTPGIMSVKDGIETWFADDGQVNNRKLVEALRVAAQRAGVTIHQNESGNHLEVRPLRGVNLRGSTRSLHCETYGFMAAKECEANKVLLCAGAWSGQINRLFFELPVRPVAGQMLALKSDKRVQHIIYGSNVYLVPRRNGRLLVGATMEDTDFSKRVTAGGVATLLNAARELVPELDDFRLLDHWAGLRPATPDGLPIIGRTPLENLFVATGHFRNGILLTPVTAQLMADCVLDEKDMPAAFALKRFHP